MVNLQPLPAEPVQKRLKTTVALLPYNLSKVGLFMFPLTETSGAAD
jgi:hypothetical protein